MTELPYTYTDRDGDELRIVRDDNHGYVSVSKEATGPASVYAPTGEDAVDVVRAVLAAAGDTGHMVLSAGEIEKIRRASELRGAVSMRERAVECAEDVFPSEAIGEIRALPLLPEETDQ